MNRIVALFAQFSPNKDHTEEAATSVNINIFTKEYSEQKTTQK